MAEKFMDEDFLLKTKTARKLYHNYAANMPILDYHCHINPKELADDRRFENITQLWLGGDHYKWRIIRANGVPEEKVTGNGASDREKFQVWAEALAKAVGNPLYHWSHLELQRYFGYSGVLNGDTAEEVWNLCNSKLAAANMSVRQIVKNSNVAGLCTTDDPIDDLQYHKQLISDPTFDVVVLPTWRPDKCVNLTAAGFGEYIAKLAEVSETKIDTIDDLCAALVNRLDYFHEVGCRISDHGLDKAFGTVVAKEGANKVFKAALEGKAISEADADSYKTFILVFLGREYAKRDWAMQLHYAAARNANSSQFAKLGPDTGYDSIGKSVDTNDFIKFMDELEKTSELPRTVVYSLNPNDEAVLASVLGCFQGEGINNKIQIGVPWWFNDTKSGMEQGLVNLANASVLGNFIGMLTDSRSFVSYPRHEYFRRILCNTLGTWAEDGEIPMDEKYLGKIVTDICFNNAKAYFKFPGL